MMKFQQPSKMVQQLKVIPGEGTYTVAQMELLLSVPEKSFTGTGTGVTVKRVDKNGTPITG